MRILNKLCRFSILILACIALGNPAAHADEKKYTVSQSTYKVLEKSRNLMDKAEYRSALAALQALIPKVKGNQYESALAYQHIAYIYLEQGNYAKGVQALENTLRFQSTLPRETVQNLRYNLAQSAAQTEQYAKAEKALDQWFADKKNPSADAWYLRGLVQYKRQHPGKAAGYLKRALNLSYHDNWAVLLLSIYLDRKQYADAAGILKTLLRFHPAKLEYWRNLSDVYLMNQDYSRALATLDLAQHRVNFEEKDILKLTRLYLHKGIPFSAAQYLNKSIQSGRVQATASNLELLANSWAAARVPENELKSLQRAAKLRNDGNLYHRCAQILLRMEKWRAAVDMFDIALTKGLKSPGQSYLLKGIAAYRAGQMQTAANAFAQAGRYKHTRNQAMAWLSQLKAGKSAS